MTPAHPPFMAGAVCDNPVRCLVGLSVTPCRTYPLADVHKQSHTLETKDIEEASLADLEWADAVLFGTPTRFGNVAAQLKQFMDTTRPLWAAGELANEVYGGNLLGRIDGGSGTPGSLHLASD